GKTLSCLAALCYQLRLPNNRTWLLDCSDGALRHYNSEAGLPTKMSDSKEKLNSQDRALGLGQPISRRDFLNSTLLASGGLLMAGATPAQLLSQEDWTGYGGVGDYSSSNGNTYPIVQSGHAIRNGDFESLPANVTDTGESYDCVIVGGGISGLAAGLF